MLGAVHGQPGLGPIITAVVALYAIRVSKNSTCEAKFLILATILGTVGDSIPRALGAYEFRAAVDVPWGYPIWMSALWTAFATTFHSSFSWLSGAYFRAALFGAIGGPLAYSAGASLGAIVIQEPTAKSLFVIGSFWSLAVPGLFYLRAWLNGRVSKDEECDC